MSSRIRKGGDLNIRRTKEVNNYGHFVGASELLCICVCYQENELTFIASGADNSLRM